MRTAHIGTGAESVPPMISVSQLVGRRAGAKRATGVKKEQRAADVGSMSVTRSRRPTVFLVALILGAPAVSACNVDPEWSRPDSTTPDYMVELQRDAEDLSEQIRRDAEELNELFNDPLGDDGLASIGVP
jgi:hypothetical protein